MKKLLTWLFVAMLTLTITPAINTQAKAKIKLNKTSISLQKGKTYTLKVTGTKKKAKWSSNKKTIATVTKKGKVTAKKPGTAVITAKIGKKKYKCKVKVWQKTTKKPANPNPTQNPVGTRTNPANPRTGITLDAEGGRVYFKLTETLKGQDAENRLLQMNQSLEEIKQGEYENPGTTLVLFIYDVKAINGYATSPLNGLDIINSYGLYDATCSHNIQNIESFYLSEEYEPMTPVNLYLYAGASSKMYEALWIPNGMTSFSNIVYKKDSTHYWVKYQF